MDIMGVSGWVLLQIAIGVLVAVSWSYMRRRKRVKGGQPRLSVKTNAVIESSAKLQHVSVADKRTYALGRSPVGRPAPSLS